MVSYRLNGMSIGHGHESWRFRMFGLEWDAWMGGRIVNGDIGRRWDVCASLLSC